MSDELARMERVRSIIDGLKQAYPDAKRLEIDIRFEWQEADDVYSELCPVVKIEVERA